MATLSGKLFRIFMIERPARRKDIPQLLGELEASGQAVLAQLDGVADTPENRRQLSHAIGIERWGQSRLKVFLGEPFIDEEYNRYRPGREVGLAELTEQFAATRAETLDLGRRLAAAGLDPAQKVAHNAMGPLNVIGWLHYLEIHAPFELRKVTA